MKKDIEKYSDITFLVDTFYAQARKDKLIGQIFESYLEGNWNTHLEKLYKFWQTVILREPAYYGKPVPLHFNMQLTEIHFSKWLEIWINTVDDLFEGNNAERAKYRAETMSNAFLNKIRKQKKDSSSKTV